MRISIIILNEDVIFEETYSWGSFSETRFSLYLAQTHLHLQTGFFPFHAIFISASQPDSELSFSGRLLYVHSLGSQSALIWFIISFWVLSHLLSLPPPSPVFICLISVPSATWLNTFWRQELFFSTTLYPQANTVFRAIRRFFSGHSYVDISTSVYNE